MNVYTKLEYHIVPFRLEYHIVPFKLEYHIVPFMLEYHRSHSNSRREKALVCTSRLHLSILKDLIVAVRTTC